MNNKLEVIGIDHGWSMMKTVTQVFVTGVKEITTTPALFGDVLEYDGKYYKIGTVRQEVKDTKVEDDSFYLLTLAAVAKELKKRGLSDAKVFLAVGLPLTRFGAERNNFIKYLTKNKRVDFRYENEAYTVYFRFLKILIIVPLGAIACSTMAGNRMVSHTMSTYCKYFLSCVFEAVTMALAIVVCNAFINAGLPSFTGSYADWAQTLIYLCEMTFTIAMTVGSVKGAQTLTSKAFGL